MTREYLGDSGRVRDMTTKTTEVFVTEVKVYILWAEVHSYYVTCNINVVMNLNEE